MKLPLLILAALLGPAEAATITVTNIGSPSSSSTVLAIPPWGSQIPWGTIAIGAFSISDEAIKAIGYSNAAKTLAGFHQLGDAFPSGFGRHPGLYLNAVTGAISEGDQWAGKAIYTVVGDGVRGLASSHYLLVFKHWEFFRPDPDATPDAILGVGKGELLAGWQSGPVGPFQHSFMGSFCLSCSDPPLPIVPEPSVTLVFLGIPLVALRRRSRPFVSSDSNVCGESLTQI